MFVRNFVYYYGVIKYDKAHLSKNCPHYKPVIAFLAGTHYGQKQQKCPKCFFGRGNCNEVISESIGSWDTRLALINRLICWYVIEGSRAKNINYFLFYMHYMYTYLHHTLHSPPTTCNSTRTRIYELPMLTLHSGTRV